MRTFDPERLRTLYRDDEGRTLKCVRDETLRRNNARMVVGLVDGKEQPVNNGFRFVLPEQMVTFGERNGRGLRKRTKVPSQFTLQNFKSETYRSKVIRQDDILFVGLSLFCSYLKRKIFDERIQRKTV